MFNFLKLVKPIAIIPAIIVFIAFVFCLPFLLFYIWIDSKRRDRQKEVF